MYVVKASLQVDKDIDAVAGYIAQDSPFRAMTFIEDLIKTQ